MSTGTWILCLAECQLTAPNGHAVLLTASESMMLLALLLAPDRLLLRKAATNPDVSERVRDHVGQSRKLDRAIAKLRRKVWWDAGLHLPINSRRGLGYQFAGPAEIDIASDRARLDQCR